MTDLYWPYPDSPVSCSSVTSSCSSVSDMSVSPAPSPRQPDAVEPEPETETETLKLKLNLKTEPVQTKTEPVTETDTEANSNSTSSWSSERLDNAGCGVVRGVTGVTGVTGATVHYPPNPYRRADPYRTPAGRSRRRRPPPPSVAAAAAAPDVAEQRLFRLAVGAGDCAAVRQMLADGARVGLNSMDGEGWTALHRAVQSGHLELVRLLVGHGANFRLADRDGFSPLHMASWGGHSHVMVYLLDLQR